MGRVLKERKHARSPHIPGPRPTMLVDRRVVGDDHHVQLAALHGLAHGGEVSDGGELGHVLAQEQLHVGVVVVAEVLRHQRGGDLRAGGRSGRRAAVPA